MNSLVRFSFVTLLAVAFSAPAQAADPAEMASIKQALQQGHNHGSAQEVLAVRARIQQLALAEPQSAELQYWLAVADWRAVPLLQFRDSDKKKAKKQCDAGVAAANQAIRLDPQMGAAYAVRSGLNGLAIGLGNPMLGMTLGPKIEVDSKKALELSPADPRVHLIDGIGTLHKPGFVGGGADKALEKLKKTIELFAAESVTDPAAPDWGRDDAYAWAGRAAMKLEDWKAAREYFDKALEFNPENGWVRTQLLPAMDKAVAKAGTEKEKS